MSTTLELERAKADEAYWNEWAQPFNWTVVGWSYRHSATFSTEVGDWVQIEGAVFRALDGVRAALADQEPGDGE